MSYSECHFRLKWFLIDSKINFIFTSKKILEKFVIILVCLSDLPIHQYWSRHNEFQYFRVNNDFVFHIVCCPLAFVITSRKYKVNIMWPDRNVRGKGLVNNLQTDIGGEVRWFGPRDFICKQYYSAPKVRLEAIRNFLTERGEINR